MRNAAAATATAVGCGCRGVGVGVGVGVGEDCCVVRVGAVLGVVTVGELPVVVGATVVLGLGGAGTLSLGIVVPGCSAVTEAEGHWTSTAPEP